MNRLIVKSVYEQLVNFPKKRTKQIRKRLDTNDERRLWASPAESWQSPRSHLIQSDPFQS